MSIVLCRIDNRLVHGQVLESWVPRVGADTILVVDDNLMEDDFHKMILESMGHGRLSIKVVGCEGAQALAKEELSDKKVMVLFHDTEQAERALECGLDFKVLNIGNIHPGRHSAKLTRNVHLTNEDAHRICTFISRGVEMDVRAVPSDKKAEVAEFCHAFEGGDS